MPPPTLVIVSGPPATGKTTLAHALAPAIPCPAVCRDEIKEGMVHAHGGEFEAAQGDPLTVRTFPVFFEVVRVLVAAGVTTIAEAAFQDTLWRRGLEPLLALVDLRIVQCTVADDAARERLARLRPAHADPSPAALAALAGARPFEGFECISIEAPSITVDTTDGYAPELADVVEFVRR